MAGKMKVFAPDSTGKMSETVGENMDIIEAKEPWAEAVFEELYAKWSEQTEFDSFIGNSTNSYHEKIIKLGYSAVPCIISKLRKEPVHLFIALCRITGENPVKEENRGKVSKMAEDWIQWWEKKESDMG